MFKKTKNSNLQCHVIIYFIVLILFSFSGYFSITIKAEESHYSVTVDGNVSDLKRCSNSIVVRDPKGDSKSQVNAYDISHLYLLVNRENLYVGISYYNDITSIPSIQHEIWLRTMGNDKKSIWVSATGSRNPGRMMINRGNGWKGIKTGKKILFAKSRDVEFKIPLRLLGNPSAVTMHYTVTAGERGKYIRSSDSTAKSLVYTKKSPLNIESQKLLQGLERNFSSVYKQVNRVSIIMNNYGINYNHAVKKLSQYSKSSEDCIRSIRLLLHPEALNARSKLELNDVNYALFLLLYMMDKNYYMTDDSISSALAMKYSHLFSKVDNSVQNELLKELKNMYFYYRFIVQWQKEKKLHYNLKEAPFFAKMIWCEPSILAGDMRTHKLKKETFKAYFLKTSKLEEYFKIAQKVLLSKKTGNLSLLVGNLENWVWKNFRYHFGTIDKTILPDDEKRIYQNKEHEVVIAGKKVVYWKIGSALKHLQWYKKHGFFSGSCGMHTQISRALLKSVGIPTFVMYYTSYRKEHGKWIMDVKRTHTFPAYYDVKFSRWYAYQVPPLIDIIGKRSYFHIFRFLHHQKLHPSLQYTEKLSFKNMRLITRYGISDSLLMKIYSQENSNGTILAKAAYSFHDTDGDGILDIDEKKFKTDKERWDTDNDGISDRWELVNGTDPLSASSPGRGFIAMDGFNDDIKMIPGNVSLPDSHGDSKVKKNIFDIKKIYAVIRNNNLYIAINYYNNIRYQKSLQHELWLSVKDGTPVRSFWITGHPGGKAGRMMKNIKGKWKKIKTGDRIQFALNRDAEFCIPLKFLGKVNEISFYYTVMSGPTGKEIRVSDKTGTLVVRNK